MLETNVDRMVEEVTGPFVSLTLNQDRGLPSLFFGPHLPTGRTINIGRLGFCAARCLGVAL